MPVIKVMKAKLSSWKGMFLSIGGKVTLLNSVLTNLPIYQLSFYKIPVKMLKEIITIQRIFLWQGVVEKWGMAWVIWESICKSRKLGGLGVKYIRIFNLALLSKWI